MPKTKPDKKLDKKLVQVRIPTEAYVAFAELCRVYGQTTAARLRTLIREELDNCYPHLQVTAAGGRAVGTRAVIIKHSEPVMTEVHLTVPKANVEESLRRVLMTGKNLLFEMPLRTPRVYGLASSYESVDGDYHLHLTERKQKS